MKPLDPYTPDGFHRLLFSSIVGAKSGEPIVPEKREAMSKEKRQWLRHVLETVYTLYGSAPMTVFQQVYEQCGNTAKPRWNWCSSYNNFRKKTKILS